MYIKTFLISVLAIFMTTATFSQEHSETYSIKIKYSMTFEQKNFAKVCEVISSAYPEFDCSSERNPTYVEENEDEYLEISIRRKRKIKMVLNTTNPSSDNIEKFHELEEKLDSL